VVGRFIVGRADLFQRLFRRPGKNFASSGETGAMTGTIPGLFGIIPANDAFKMSANRRAQRHFSISITVSSHFFAVQLKNLPFVPAEGAERLAFGSRQASLVRDNMDNP
jgi:hypothetical protein